MTNSAGTTVIAGADHRRSFRRARLCAGVYLTVSAATLVVAAVLHSHSGLVTPTVWVRGTIVTLSAAITWLLVRAAADGSRGAYRRLRILSGVMLAVIVVLLAIPGSLPLWVKLEQGLCGLLLAGMLALVSAAHVRAVFAAS